MPWTKFAGATDISLDAWKKDVAAVCPNPGAIAVLAETAALALSREPV
jgi:hypothetical protein